MGIFLLCAELEFLVCLDLQSERQSLINVGVMGVNSLMQDHIYYLGCWDGKQVLKFSSF